MILTILAIMTATPEPLVDPVFVDNKNGEHEAAIDVGAALPPSADVIEAAYVRKANWTCERLIDLCPDDAVVFPDTVHAEQIGCDIKSGRAACTFVIRRFDISTRCKSVFTREPSAISGELFWSVERERNRRDRLKPKIECSN